jgi:hypothetical protein
MVHVEDDFLPIDLLEDLFLLYNNNKTSTSTGWVEKNQTHYGVAKLVSKALQYFQIQHFAGLEIWTHYNSRPDWHYDRDEKKYERERVNSFPLCSIIFYPRINIVSGGELVIKDGITIQPRTNRLVLMSPGTYHKVEPFVGERFSLLVNVWDKNIYE